LQVCRLRNDAADDDVLAGESFDLIFVRRLQVKGSDGYALGFDLLNLWLVD
jgi:hypothetical protein